MSPGINCKNKVKYIKVITVTKRTNTMKTGKVEVAYYLIFLSMGSTDYI